MLPGPDDLVDAANGPGAVRKGAHRLRAANPVRFGDAGPLRRRQHRRVERAVAPGGRHQHDLRHPGHPGRDGGHQHRRGIGGPSSRHVDADAPEGPDLLAEPGAVLVADAPGGGQRGPMESLDAGRRVLEGVDRRRPEALAGRGELGCGDGEAVRGEADAVEALGEVEERRVALGADPVEDRGDALDHLGVGRGGRTIERPQHAGRAAERACRTAGSSPGPRRGSRPGRALAHGVDEGAHGWRGPS